MALFSTLWLVRPIEVENWAQVRQATSVKSHQQTGQEALQGFISEESRELQSQKQ